MKNLLKKIVDHIKNFIAHRPTLARLLHMEPADHLIQGDRSKKFRDKTIYSDVDGTLVIWHMDDHPEAIPCNNYGEIVKLVPHKENINLIKKYYAEGYKIVVWSAAGEGWAKEVVKKLKIKKYIYATLSKPEFYIDDLSPKHFLPEKSRLYETYTPPVVEVKK